MYYNTSGVACQIHHKRGRPVRAIWGHTAPFYAHTMLGAWGWDAPEGPEDFQKFEGFALSRANNPHDKETDHEKPRE